MNREHHYSLTIKWTGNKGSGTSGYRDYARNHTVMVDQKEEIKCSSDPVFLGDKTKYSPEELMVAAVAGCHMLWYLHLCADSGIIVEDYLDHPVGTLIEYSDGSGHFTNITLQPVITVTDKSVIDKANELHKRANELCFIANSCNFIINHKPVYKLMENDG